MQFVSENKAVKKKKSVSLKLIWFGIVNIDRGDAALKNTSLFKSWTQTLYLEHNAADRSYVRNKD